MPRIRRGGGRLRAGGGRTRNQDCCCNEPIPCATINDELTRATWEISYEILGLTITNGSCGAACNSTGPLAGVIPYTGGGFALDWYKEMPICGDIKYFVTAGIRCLSGTVSLELALGISVGSTSVWAVSWATSVPESSFILGNEFTMPRQSALGSAPGSCVPSPANGIGTTCKFTTTLA